MVVVGLSQAHPRATPMMIMGEIGPPPTSQPVSPATQPMIGVVAVETMGKTVCVPPTTGPIDPATKTPMPTTAPSNKCSLGSSNG
jgi:hypothetical protein